MSKFKRYERYKDSGVEWIGEIPEHWEIKKIKYISNITMGQSPKSEECSLDETGLPFLQGNAEFTSLHPIPKIYCNTANKFSKVNDILLSVRAPVGAMNISDRVYGIGRGLCAITANKVQVRYLWYSMNVSLEELFIKSKGSTFEAVTVTDVNNLLSILPPKNEQIAIANFLDQKTAEIDGLIADKEKLIELLQEKRQAIITEAVTKGLNPNVRMKDSGIEWIGEIPEHWEVCGFTKYISSIIDYRGKTPEKVDEGVFLVTAKNIKNGRIDYSLSQEYVKSEEYEQIMRRGLPEIGDVVFTTEAPLGEVANVDRTDVAFAQRVIKFRGKVEKLDNYYLKYWIMSHGFQHDLQSYATGSTATGIKASKLSKLIILLPRLEEQKAIVNFLDQKTAEIDDLIFDIYTQIQKLKEDIHEYFEREVKPHVPDAWIDETKTKIGYEIPFTRHFYKYQPLRPSEEIMKEIRELEQSILEKLKKVMGE